MSRRLPPTGMPCTYANELNPVIDITRSLKFWRLSGLMPVVATSTVNAVTLTVGFTIDHYILPFGNSGLKYRLWQHDLLVYISERNGRSTACRICKLGCRRFYGEFIDSNIGEGASFYLLCQLWRCAVLCEGISRDHRLATLIIVFLLAILASFGMLTSSCLIFLVVHIFSSSK